MPAPSTAPSAPFRLHLLGGMRLTQLGVPFLLPSSTWRLVALLAISDRPVDRARVASSLWLDKSEDRAHANLRSCLWRLRQVTDDLVTGTATHLQLAAQVTVDLRDLTELAHRIVDHRAVLDLDDIDVHPFAAELLPDWYDDFVDTERERVRQLGLHALEALALRLGRAGRRDRALDVALTAVAAAPLRESAHRVVIALHLEEGNVSEALRHYGAMSVLLREHLDVDPSPAVHALVARWLPLRPADLRSVSVR